jgi:hypothetical protein
MLSDILEVLLCIHHEKLKRIDEYYFGLEVNNGQLYWRNHRRLSERLCLATQSYIN